jgi:hypothetical protein
MLILGRCFGGCRFGAGVAAGLLFAFAFAPSRSQAGCGDYVTSRLSNNGSAQTHTHNSDPVEHQAPMHGHSPCSGPNCSQNPSQIPLTTTKISAERLDWGIAQIVGSDAESEITVLKNFDTSHPIRRQSSIFHPPRFAAIC